MTKKDKQSVAQQRQVARQAREKRERRDKRPPAGGNGPWLSRRTGLIVISVLSLLVAAFMTWNASTAEEIGLGEAVLWGLGFGASIWVIFTLSLLFFGWVRGQR